LRDYWNTIQADISGIWRIGDIKQFWISRSTSGWFDGGYCNATFTIPAASRSPYPWRTRCYPAWNVIRIEISTDMTQYTPGVHDTYNLRVYFKFWIPLINNPDNGPWPYPISTSAPF